MNTLEVLKKRYAGLGTHIGIKQVVADEMQVKEISGGFEVVAVANTAAVDLDNEVVVPAGADTAYFERNRSIFLNHDPLTPIGSLRRLKLQGSSWYARFSIASTTLGQDVRTLIREKVINGVSIGFAATNWGRPTDEEIKTYGKINSIVRQWRWLELSVTPMPCNPDCIIQAASDGAISEETAKTLLFVPQSKRLLIVA